ncbi:MAG: extracellular solute-binding protein [Anaerolineales bacterium]|nr:extracellular solute-binding protein [Anaerolineales bacterium]
MSKKFLTMIFATLIILSLVMTACTPEPPVVEVPPTEEEVVPTKAPEPTEEPEEPMMDLSGVTVQFWHVYGEGDPRNETILALVDEFNASNEYGITVEALDQGSYNDLEDKVNAGIQSGDTPQIAQAYTSALNNWDTVDMVVDLNPFVSDATYGLTEDEIADIYPGVYALGVTPGGARLAWPFSQSANVMVYNFTWAKELGFDAAPTTPEDLKTQLCAAAEANATDDNPDNDGTGGMVWYASASNYLSFLHAYGGVELNADGTAYDFNTPAAKAAALYVNDLKADGCTFETESYPNPEQANRLALVTLSSTSGLKYYGYAFSDAENDDEWGFLAFPGPDGGQGVDAFTQTMGILKSTPEQELASWIFIKYLTAPANQATWIEASGYLPTQYSTEGMLVDYIASVPQYQSTLALAALGQGEPETFTAWYSVRRAVDDAAAMLYAAETAEEVEAILAELNITAAELVAEIE